MGKIQTLSIDIESYSDVDLQKCGVYKYAQSPAFEILLFGVSVNGGEVMVYDLAQGDTVPMEIIEALTDDSVTKWAFNAAFERVCLSVWLQRHYPEHFSSYSINEDTVGDYLDPSEWKCSMIWSAYMGLPLSLAGSGMVLGVEEQKLKEGKDLIRYFCVPCKPTKVNGGRTRNLPEHDTDKWSLFKFYNKRDVEVEMSIQDRLKKYPVPDFVWDEYHLDQEINDRGIALDMNVVENAIAFDSKSKAELAEKMQELTDLDNPNSVVQMKQWLADNGLEMDSLGKKEVAQAVKTAPKELAEVLLLRQQLSKSSVKKYQAMKNAVCEDGRARGMFQFYGANRSGRWAGRMIQLQNLPQNHMPDLEQARGLVASGNYDAMELLYDDIPDTLSQLIRTAFVPRTGMKFVVADFSAIEARVLSFLAKENWRMEVFQNNGDIYCASASAMFGVPVEKHGENGHLRQKGKIAELALGYGGSVGALKAMGALDMGLAEEELQPLVDSWRAANPNIVRFWWNVDRCVKDTVKNRVTTETHGIRFIYQSGMMFIELPSGRRLSYVKPRMGENRFGGESVTYEGVGGTKKWERIESYGPKFVENIVQEISRDILAYAMRTLSHCFICGHVHDELIIECSMGVSIDAICEQMGRTPPWINGLLLRADGYECSFYKKD
ncbi:DNA polymerase [Bariatricus massiliensis]|uniref:DNA-directed DNA polymerase n=1 Tax=Bariatricus massiliensis TaxID=1745713 RepID=A0ABS8DG57_9FIRM|nr:DNA polymerase [Bariatricus massiliensis]MCB7304089.1 DNA polymerase [Bariatricus massiliensis]MCB7374480.1 DNA polymerase [Bariatricus massiliensis]MCB7387199.1 DNA polymerase [Bariatricus massiliensis]MCB7411361.1 DNA polymerase [Bariatricus massiliensis]MCQ5252694.1 DNA polymerase [Bariatricus massiliensis]